jgi:hypothetical protein
LSLERLRQDCEERGKQIHFRLLEFYDVEEAGKEQTACAPPPTYPTSVAQTMC